jgi:hypothetical protein
MPTGGEPRSVSRFEHNLLWLLRWFLRQASVQQVLPLLDAKLDRPKCLRRPAVELIKDALGKGSVLLLTKLGGWRRERHLRGEEIREGRLWERTTPQQLGLTFTGATLDFLIWITAGKQTEEEQTWQPGGAPALGDLMLLHFAFEQLRSHERGRKLLGSEPLQAHGLGWLAYPDEHARASSEGQPDFGPWITGVGACVLEALQPALAERWVQMETDKGRITAWQQMRDLGRAQERALEAFLKAVEHANRLDLARFLLVAASRLLTAHAAAEMWVQNLWQHAQRLADRAETYRGALALLRQMPRLQQWDRKARSVGYFDEGYQASQLWKADWERYVGDVLTERAQTIIRQLDPMRQTEG